MSELEIPERAWVIVDQVCCCRVHSAVSAAPIIVAAKLRIFAERLKRVAGFEDGLRSGLLEAARIAIEEAAELDPEGSP